MTYNMSGWTLNLILLMKLGCHGDLTHSGLDHVQWPLAEKVGYYYYYYYYNRTQSTA